MNEARFDGMGKEYSQFRPCYPDAFMDYLYSDIGMAECGAVADIGSGTGILTKQLLLKGSRVYAVEPNDSMRAVAEDDLKAFTYFYSYNGTAEDTGLLDGCVDFVTAAQAFHWFDRRRFKAECGRILKPGGKVILVWNRRDESSVLVQETDIIHKEYCPDFKGFSGGMRGAGNAGEFNDFFVNGYEAKVFENGLEYTEQGFIGRNLSASYALKEDNPRYADYIRELKAVFANHSKDGILVMPNQTHSFTGNV
ncbi:MAG: class I SAM-dependent methyltransferase [Defluviitaleaceae bacterium]|nr:class I SAM-dependent methyltransferase [Defluviitaleaceae bacterium]MCL2835506.1 class I SAM-dependent methyltransferase [Defluviitaleaceae bacterium]